MNTDEHVTAGALAPALSGIPSQATHSRSPSNRPVLTTMELPYSRKAAIPQALFVRNVASPPNHQDASECHALLCSSGAVAMTI